MATKPRFLDLVRERIRTKHYSIRTEEAYVGWIKKFIFFIISVTLLKWVSLKWSSFDLLGGWAKRDFFDTKPSISGLRLMELVRLRVQDIDFGYHSITVRAGKGDKDRVVMLPPSTIEALQAQLTETKRIHDIDLSSTRVRPNKSGSEN